MDRLDTLRVFLRVAELGSFTRAADGLGLPKASVSQAIQRLEAELGTQLLHRTTRRVHLTADGTQLQQRAHDLLDDMEELQGLFRRQTSELSGRLRVDMPGGLARNLVIPQLPAFLAQHPALEVELSATDRRVDVVREGFDCVLRVGNLDDSSLVARPLGHMHIVNVASPAYLAARGVPRGLADLDQHALVHYVGRLGQRSPGFEYFDGQQYRSWPMRGALTVNNADSYSAAALAGLGIIQVPEMGARQALREGRLVQVLPDCVAEPMPVNLVYAQRRHLPRRVQAFMHWLAGLLADALQAARAP
ncbi:LysR family transcriptional regulator [Stenotrophomonas sp. ZAC14D2_NAIMI4_7]|uniref:LysR family transcriptional regulator n=1 Tax=Stenotrophomonas sp. ZAC14D2_NAIMI4_7 TaxID=2072405 RepID=UPI000D540E98|nr:LysR family transcriptional regulator [Stenotrophomonas sp. ZAC14D2_NAIMI4_7]AWH17809.1 LysR family transcriptional regulator [Stenotrophomonas sp. ZAC14D2_NAIMI4_7]